jgi:hypothetical protein
MATKMEMRPGSQPTIGASGRGSGAVARRPAREARRKLLIRLPETMVDDLKIAVAHEKMSIQDFCEQVLGPAIQQVLTKHGLETRRASDAG